MLISAACDQDGGNVGVADDGAVPGVENADACALQIYKMSPLCRVSCQS